MISKNYFEYEFEVDNKVVKYDDLGTLEIKNDNIFCGIEFSEKYLRLYIKENTHATYDELKDLSSKKILNIFIDIIKTENAICTLSYKQIASSLNNQVKMNVSDTITMTETFKIIRYDVEGKQISDEEYNKQQLELKKVRFDDIVNRNFTIKEIDNTTFQTLRKVFEIKDPVIKYFVLYSWLGSLCQSAKGYDDQNVLNSFIENSTTYSNIPQSYKIFQRRMNRDDRIVFTYLRNLIGHSINDALLVNDSTIIGKITTYTHWLIQLIIERLEIK